MALAAELLSVASEEELDLFLGKQVKGAFRKLKKVGRFVGKIAKPLGGVFKGVVKAALPFVGGALGSFIPIPGVGTALGTALGGAVSKALEMELGELSQDEQEFEIARRFVRLAGTAHVRLLRLLPTRTNRRCWKWPLWMRRADTCPTCRPFPTPLLRLDKGHGPAAGFGGVIASLCSGPDSGLRFRLAWERHHDYR